MEKQPRNAAQTDWGRGVARRINELNLTKADVYRLLVEKFPNGKKGENVHYTQVTGNISGVRNDLKVKVKIETLLDELEGGV